jgi:hypothetical protein
LFVGGVGCGVWVGCASPAPPPPPTPTAGAVPPPPPRPPPPVPRLIQACLTPATARSALFFHSLTAHGTDPPALPRDLDPGSLSRVCADRVTVKISGTPSSTYCWRRICVAFCESCAMRFPVKVPQTRGSGSGCQAPTPTTRHGRATLRSLPPSRPGILFVRGFR